MVTTTNFNGKGKSIQPWNNVTDSMTLVERHPAGGCRHAWSTPTP